MRADSGVVAFVSHWRWETSCFNRKKPVCPPPCRPTGLSAKTVLG
jgi:hypothetical protein